MGNKEHPLLNKKVLRQMLREEMTKREITDLVVSKVTQNMQSADFEKKVKEIASKVVEELFKILWIKRAFWKNDIKK